MALATVVTVYVVPLLYRWLAPRTGSPQTVARRLRGLIDAQKAKRAGNAGSGAPQPAE
ncbi:hypothetical protein [Altererythrobacter lauratis]|uniref:Efflux RND transporter permease subunit n=1 Tax=Alteraurantiacibacter lauratis TaxID=2054627 RepID=A0ABV7EJY7_9SPHN